MVVLVERDDLAVEDRRARPEVEANVTELGKGGREALVIACEGSHPSPGDVDHGAHPVPLELVRPALVARGQLSGQDEHRSYVVGHWFETLWWRLHSADHPLVVARGQENGSGRHGRGAEGGPSLFT